MTLQEAALDPSVVTWAAVADRALTVAFVIVVLILVLGVRIRLPAKHCDRCCRATGDSEGKGGKT